MDTTAANVGLKTQLSGVLAGSQYQPADPVLFAAPSISPLMYPMAKSVPRSL